MTRIAALAALVLIAACSNNPNIIEPSPLPELEREYKVKRLWEEGAGDGIKDARVRLRPAVTGRAVYAADLNGRVSGFQREDGERLWRRETEKRISGGVSADYGMVLFGTREGEVVALAADTGEPMWQARVNSEVLAPPVTNGELVVTQTLDGHVVALDAADGSERWNFHVSVPVLTLRGTSTPRIDGDRVLVAFASGKLVSLKTDSGVPAWEAQVAEPTGRSELDRLVDVDTNLVRSNGAIFAATFQGKLAVLDPTNGRPYYKRDMSTHVPMDAGAGALFIADDESRVHSIDQRSGDTLWRQDKLRGRRLVGVVVHQELVTTGDEDGYLHWLDPSTGRPVARRRHDWDGFAGAPVVRGDTLYALSRDGDLAAYRLQPKDGS